VGRLLCCLRLLPKVGQWSERVQGVATPVAVLSISVREYPKTPKPQFYRETQ
jgi:hypothetical protein